MKSCQPFKLEIRSQNVEVLNDSEGIQFVPVCGVIPQSLGYWHTDAVATVLCPVSWHGVDLQAALSCQHNGLGCGVRGQDCGSGVNV